MNMLIEIMDQTRKYRPVLWWGDELSNKVLIHAHRLGLVNRLSTTQVQWTERGVELARKYGGKES